MLTFWFTPSLSGLGLELHLHLEGEPQGELRELLEGLGWHPQDRGLSLGFYPEEFGELTQLLDRLSRLGGRYEAP